LDLESVTKPKKKRKHANKKVLDAIKEEEGKQDEDKPTSLDPVVFMQEEQNQKQQSFV
jgi:FK506-binding nuclear protein